MISTFFSIVYNMFAAVFGIFVPYSAEFLYYGFHFVKLAGFIFLNGMAVLLVSRAFRKARASQARVIKPTSIKVTKK